MAPCLFLCLGSCPQRITGLRRWVYRLLSQRLFLQATGCSTERNHDPRPIDRKVSQRQAGRAPCVEASFSKALCTQGRTAERNRGVFTWAPPDSVRLDLTTLAACSGVWFTTHMTNGPDFSFEQALITSGALRVAGVDEVGRGPLAGPVTAAAVILDPANIPDGLNDSKALTKKKREQLEPLILSTAKVSIAHASVEEIDEINILRASHLAMERAVAGLEIIVAGGADHALIDGNMIPMGLTVPATTIIKGDARSLSIAAASIVAKISRDRIMAALAQQYPGYGWDTNAGYGSKSHMSALQNLGVTPHHRRSFKPVHNML